MDLQGKRVIVVGLGRSGRAAAAVCHSRGAKVLGTDTRSAAVVEPALTGLNIELSLGGHSNVDWLAADLVVVSPGVPPMQALLDAEAAGVPVIGELELACRFTHCPIIAVGGTNGKSTTTVLLAGMLESAGLRTFAGGNLGAPLSEVVGTRFDVAVVEVSSFQLERITSFRPKTSLLLNISEDHLDRYADFNAYADAKGNAFVNQESSDIAVLPAGDALCLEQAARGKGRLVSFGVGGDYQVSERVLTHTPTGDELSLAGVALHGRHNLENIAAAVAGARSIDVSWQAIAAGLRSFRPLAHRMARVASRDGVTYYDDSKATNVGAAVTALLGLEESRAILIAGGRDKGGSYAALRSAAIRRAKAVVVLGEASGVIEAAMQDAVTVHRVDCMADAVALAASLAVAGEAVLLSPACSSFDMYGSYAERGEDFAHAVLSLSSQEDKS